MGNTLIIANNSSRRSYNNIVIFTITVLHFRSGPGVPSRQEAGANGDATVVPSGDWPEP